MEPESTEDKVDGPGFVEFLPPLCEVKQDWPVLEEESVKRSRSGRVLKRKTWCDESIEYYRNV